MARTSSITMLYMMGIVCRAPAVDKQVCDFFLPAGLREAQPWRYCFYTRGADQKFVPQERLVCTIFTTFLALVRVYT